MREIPLTQGKVTLVDDEDYEWASAFPWCLLGQRYAGRRLRLSECRSGDPPRKAVYLHRLIAQAADGMDVDHINHDTLDNRRANLRVVSHRENGQNLLPAQANSSAGCIGVRWDKQRQRYVAQLMEGRRCIFLGRYERFEDAERAALTARLERWPNAPEWMRSRLEGAQ